MQPFKVKAKDIRWLTDQAFSTKKRTVTVEVAEKVNPYNTFWDGGSKNSYRAVKLATGETAELITGNSPWSAIAEGVAIPLEPGIAVVEESVFCGKLMPLRVYIHPANLAPFLNPSHHQTA